MMAWNSAPSVWLHSPLCGRKNDVLSVVSGQFHAACIPFSTEPNLPVEENTVAVLLVDEPDASTEAPACLCELLSKDIPVIVVYTGSKTLPFYRAWQWLSMGADDVIGLFDQVHLGELVKSRLQRRAVIDRILESDRVRHHLLGTSKIWKKTLRQAVEIACFSSAPVLILGESGTGKELVARLIHDLDKRQDKQDMVLLDCTTIVPELSGSEFFGHEKGAFTNAFSTREGAFALADRGTLFLDEIGELPARLQAELLRVSQEGTYKRVGSNMWQKTRFRLVSATNRNLLEEVEKGNFRQDLYYRIRTCTVCLPPLRERKTDIPELATHFLGQALNTDTPPPFSQQMFHFLMSRDFPGNVRELKQLIARIAYKYCSTGPVTLGDVPDTDREPLPLSTNSWQENGFREAISQAVADGAGMKEIKRIAGETAIEIAVENAAGNLQEAARRLDVSDRLVQGWWAGRSEKPSAV